MQLLTEMGVWTVEGTWGGGRGGGLFRKCIQGGGAGGGVPVLKTQSKEVGGGGYRFSKHNPRGGGGGTCSNNIDCKGGGGGGGVQTGPPKSKGRISRTGSIEIHCMLQHLGRFRTTFATFTTFGINASWGGSFQAEVRT